MRLVPTADGIAIERIKPGHPQQNGRHERMQHVLAGQRVGIKDVDAGIWIVSFMQYDLGYPGAEDPATMDNRFGPRLLPMS